jgi:hypothetical protein
VVNHAAGRGDSRTQIRLDDLDGMMQQTVTRAVHVLEQALRTAP